MAESTETSPPPKRNLWQWLWRSRALAQARQSVRDVPAAERQRLARAQAALELAERAAEPIDLSLSLYREAAYWALSAQDASATASDLQGAFAQVPEDVLSFAAAGPEGLAHVRSALLTKTFRETAEDPAEQQRSDARAADAFVKALIDRRLGPERRVGRVLVQRWVRSTLSLLLLLGLLLASVSLYSSLQVGPDLAAGKPWKASSSNPGVARAQRGEYLFHSQEEDSPWMEVDLKKATEFSLVEVINRRDCCPDRAIPAVIEVSTDHKRWREVSRRSESFSVWEARFAPTTARYVRMRVTRRSTLHLAGLAVRAR